MKAPKPSHGGGLFDSDEEDVVVVRKPTQASRTTLFAGSSGDEDLAAPAAMTPADTTSLFGSANNNSVQPKPKSQLFDSDSDEDEGLSGLFGAATNKPHAGLFD
jgi:hypothetical protein